jgi:hypothetical protein
MVTLCVVYCCPDRDSTSRAIRIDAAWFVHTHKHTGMHVAYATYLPACLLSHVVVAIAPLWGEDTSPLHAPLYVCVCVLHLVLGVVLWVYVLVYTSRPTTVRLPPRRRRYAETWAFCLHPARCVGVVLGRLVP